MSGTTTTAKYIAATEYGTQIFSGERGDYGIYKFADPHRQATYEHHEIRFTKMQNLKTAYDRQELLRKMRADIKREYLTRKKQMKKLQMDAAVDFRNAESSLQEHFATEAADHQPYIRGIDIHSPLVSKIQLPNAQILDLNTFDAECAKSTRIFSPTNKSQSGSLRRRSDASLSTTPFSNDGWNVNTGSGALMNNPAGNVKTQTAARVVAMMTATLTKVMRWMSVTDAHSLGRNW
jgi:hypothetical protein